MEESVAEALLYGGDREAKVTAAREIGNLSSKQRQKLVEKGVISPLVFMLHLQDYECIEAALLALLSLACGSERNKARIAKSGAIPLLLTVLQWQSGPVFDLAIAALLILSSSTANKVAIAKSGAVELLIEILSSQVNPKSSGQTLNLQAMLDIISTLHNLATCSQIIPTIVASGTVLALFQLLYSLEKSSELVEKAMALLEKMVTSSEVALKEAAGIDGSIQLLVEAVEEGSQQSREHAVGILLVICKSCRERYRGMILKEGGMAGLLQLSVDGTWRAKEKAKDLVKLLRDGSSRSGGGGGGCSRSRTSKNVILEQVMRQIDRGESVGGTELRMVEEMIAKLRT